MPLFHGSNGKLREGREEAQLKHVQFDLWQINSGSLLRGDLHLPLHLFSFIITLQNRILYLIKTQLLTLFLFLTEENKTYKLQKLKLQLPEITFNSSVILINIMFYQLGFTFCLLVSTVLRLLSLIVDRLVGKPGKTFSTFRLPSLHF